MAVSMAPHHPFFERALDAMGPDGAHRDTHLRALGSHARPSKVHRVSKRHFACVFTTVSEYPTRDKNIPGRGRRYVF